MLGSECVSFAGFIRLLFLIGTGGGGLLFFVDDLGDSMLLLTSNGENACVNIRRCVFIAYLTK